MLALLCVWVKVKICIWPNWCHCHWLSLAPVNPDWFYLPGLPLCCWLSRVVPNKIQEGHKMVVCVFVCVWWNLVSRCIVKNSRPSSNFKFMGPTPGLHPKMWLKNDTGQWICQWKLSACALVKLSIYQQIFNETTFLTNNATKWNNIPGWSTLKSPTTSRYCLDT